MKKIIRRISYILRIFYLMSFLAIFSIPIQAKTINPESSENKETNKKDKVELYTETGFEYIDNVYGLTDSQISGMEANSNEDQISGRYNEMDSAADFIISPEIGVKFNSSSPLGGKFSMTSWIKYNYYNKNNKSSFPEAKIRLKNSIGENGALTLEGNFLSGFFKKNYLSDVNDANTNGNIPREERIYSAAVYDEYEGIVSYEHKIIKNKDSMVSGLDFRPFAGYRYRQYNSTFSNRDQNIAFLGLGLNIEFISKIGLEMIYQYESVSSPDNRELFLFDETTDGVDVNSDGRIRSNAPFVTNVDRSSNRHTIEINPSFNLTKNTSLYFGYERRLTTYTSNNPLDIEHYNNEGDRQQIKSGIKHSFAKAWSAEFEYGRTDDDDDEDGDYSQNNFLAKIKYDFNI